VLKNLRISILNWLAAGRIVIEKDRSQEYKSMSTYTIGGGIAGGSGPVLVNSNGNMMYNTSTPITAQTLTIKITPANGGTIVSTQVSDNNYELHIIPDGSDFDRELGKIITVSKLKS
jgi:hypothetical protein